MICFDESIRLDPKNECSWLDKGYILYLLNKLDEGLFYINEALKINPKSKVGWINKGIVLTK